MSKYISLNDDLQRYIQTVSVPHHDILHRLRAETATLEHGYMMIPPEQGSFLSLLLKTMNARRTLEIGVFTGYSALVAAMALPDDGQVIALDRSEEYTAIARRYWEEAGVAHKIDLRIGAALDSLEALSKDATEWFDFAFIDADKLNLDDYYELCLEMLRHGGIVAIDNALRSGQVIAPDMDENARNLHELNLKVRDDPRVDASLVPIGDGILLARKR
jgi:predicted O-methyltransferase YrrM